MICNFEWAYQLSVLVGFCSEGSPSSLLKGGKDWSRRDESSVPSHLKVFKLHFEDEEFELAIIDCFLGQSIFCS
jgi:hypothetical protein